MSSFTHMDARRTALHRKRKLVNAVSLTLALAAMADRRAWHGARCSAPPPRPTDLR